MIFKILLNDDIVTKIKQSIDMYGLPLIIQAKINGAKLQRYTPCKATATVSDIEEITAKMFRNGAYFVEFIY